MYDKNTSMLFGGPKFKMMISNIPILTEYDALTIYKVLSESNAGVDV